MHAPSSEFKMLYCSNCSVRLPRQLRHSCSWQRTHAQWQQHYCHSWRRTHAQWQQHYCHSWQRTMAQETHTHDNAPWHEPQQGGPHSVLGADTSPTLTHVPMKQSVAACVSSHNGCKCSDRLECQDGLEETQVISTAPKELPRLLQQPLAPQIIQFLLQKWQLNV